MTNYFSDVWIVIGGNTLQNIIDYRWREVSNSGDQSVVPIFTMNSVNPVAFKTAHKYVTGEFTTAGTVGTVLNAYMPSNGTNSVLGTLTVSGIDITGSNTITETFYTVYFTPGERIYTDNNSVSTYQYKFVASRYTVSP